MVKKVVRSGLKYLHRLKKGMRSYFLKEPRREAMGKGGEKKEDWKTKKIH